MFRSCLVNIHIIRRLPPAREVHVANRKELIPLIKHLHPDLTTHLPETARGHNMACIQNLNDMWDTLENNLNYAAGRNLAFGVDVKYPFRRDYDLTCFISSFGNKSDPVKVSYTLSIPDDMCKKQSITHKTFTDSVDAILMQQGQMFSAAGLANPWEININDILENNEDPLGPTGVKEGLSVELETLMYEKWIQKDSRMNRLGKNSNKQRRSDLNQLYNPKFTNNAPCVDSLFGNRFAREAFFEDEVDAFLSDGHVVVADLSAQDEYLSVQKVRQWLIDYGDVLSFSADKWSAVYIMLYQYGGPDKSKRSRSKVHGSKPGEEEKEDKQAIVKKDFESTAKDGESADPDRSTVTKGGYVLERYEDQYIMKVPYNFRPKQLLHFTGRQLPAAQLIQPRTSALYDL